MAYKWKKPIWLWLKIKKYNTKLIKNWNALGLDKEQLVDEKRFYDWVIEAIQG